MEYNTTLYEIKFNKQHLLFQGWCSVLSYALNLKCKDSHVENLVQMYLP